MGRMINEKDLIELYDENDRLWWGSALDDIQNLPTVEAIPKDQYEARLKANMVAILTELQLEIEELNTPPAYQDEDYFLIGTNRCSELIQQKIDKYKVESEG